MLIKYRDRKLRKLCESNREAVRRLGANSAKKLQSRLADVEAAANVKIYLHWEIRILW